MKMNLNNIPITVELFKSIEAGKNEPDHSNCRSSWKTIGFYLPHKTPKGCTTVIRTEWRH